MAGGRRRQGGCFTRRCQTDETCRHSGGFRDSNPHPSCNRFANRAPLLLSYALDEWHPPMTDAQHFEAFLHNYQNMVFSTAMRLTANQSEAEDITQEVFLRAYERFAELRDSSSVG